MSTMMGGADNGARGELVPVGPPPTLRWNMWATAAWCAFSILSNLVLFGQRPYLRRTLIASNAKAKTPVANYTAAKVEHDVHSQLVGGLIESLLVAVILLLLAALTWRGRPWARWVLLALAVIGLPFRVGVVAQLVLGAVPSSAPGPYRAALVVAGLASLLVCVLLLHRNTRTYFAALRETQRGTLPPVPGARTPGRRLTRPTPSGTTPTGSAPAGSSASGSLAAGGGLGALLGLRRRPAPGVGAQGRSGANSAAPADNTAADGTAADGTAGVGLPAQSASRRSTATRPGRVKAKGSGNRSGRFKSRQQ